MPQGKLRYYTELDGLRGIAALMVFFFHFPIGSSVYAIHKVALFGQTGVTLFFVLSGFLITRILLATKGERYFYSKFYIRRGLRIFPLYYLALGIIFIIVPWFSGKVAPAGQFYYWVYLQNIWLSFQPGAAGPIHLWSLAVEEHFYLLWPLAVAFTNRRQLAGICGVMLFTAMLCRLGFTIYNNTAAVHYFTFCCTDALACGALLALAEQSGLHLSHKKTNNYLLPVITVLVFILWLFPHSHPVVVNIRPLLLNAFYISLIWRIITLPDGSSISRLLGGGVPAYTGLISYGIYVYHPLCIDTVQTHLHVLPNVAKFFCSLAFTVFCASTSYFMFEKYFLNLKKVF